MNMDTKYETKDIERITKKVILLLKNLRGIYTPEFDYEMLSGNTDVIMFRIIGGFSSNYVFPTTHEEYEKNSMHGTNPRANPFGDEAKWHGGA